MVSAGAVAATGALAAWRRNSDRSSATLEAIRHIGEVYLRAHPDQDADVLRRALPADVDLSGNPAQALRQLRDEVRHDYAVGDVEVLDGWRLSRTAVRTAALFAVEEAR